MSDVVDLELESFGDEVKSWLQTACPPSMRTPMTEAEVYWGGRKGRFPSRDAQAWFEAMLSRGFIAPTWAPAFGGAGLSAAQNEVLQRELRALHARPPIISFGLWMLGPVLLEYATPEQQLEYLPPIARGEIRWCQGYSEPGAGSDLASLQTRCEDLADQFRLQGQKIWTSYADVSDWMFCLVRTDRASKQGGISFVLFDLAAPGVEVRPIPLISGASPFCETFLNEVLVPKQNLVGALNGGWAIAKRLLAYERTNSGLELGAGGQDVATRVLTSAAAAERSDDGDLRSRRAAQAMAEHAFGLGVNQARGGAGQLASVLKVAGAEVNQGRFETLVESLGLSGLGWGDGFEPEDAEITRQWLRSKGNSIEGGTTEINLNIIAKRILGLPDPS